MECWATGVSQPEPFLARQYAIHPALLVGSWRVQGRERLGELPEPGVLADAVIDQEPLLGIGPAASKEEHGLVDPVEYGLCGCVLW